MTRAKLIRLGSHWLKGSYSPELDAEVLLAKLTHESRSLMLAHTTEHVGLPTIAAYVWLLVRAKVGVPIAYLVGYREFYGRRFKVTQATLVPRPETELLVQLATNLVRDQAPNLSSIADIGTGSGCIAITLALNLPHLPVYAVDSSAPALKVAQKNTQNHNVADKIHFFQGNLFEPLLTQHLVSPSTLLIANLPYLRPNEYHGGLRFEPRNALVGGLDGLTLYQELFLQLKNLEPELRPHWVLLELHPPTAHEVAALAKGIFPQSQVTISPDLSGLPRVLTLHIQ